MATSSRWQRVSETLSLIVRAHQVGSAYESGAITLDQAKAILLNDPEASASEPMAQPVVSELKAA